MSKWKAPVVSVLAHGLSGLGRSDQHDAGWAGSELQPAAPSRRPRAAVVAASVLVAAAVTLGALAGAGVFRKTTPAQVAAPPPSPPSVQGFGRPAFQGVLNPYREPSALGAPLTADVIVIGAGVAGLAAARRLAKEGLDVLVLEARVSEGTAMSAGGMSHDKALAVVHALCKC